MFRQDALICLFESLTVKDLEINKLLILVLITAIKTISVVLFGLISTELSQ